MSNLICLLLVSCPYFDVVEASIIDKIREFTYVRRSNSEKLIALAKKNKF